MDEILNIMKLSFTVYSWVLTFSLFIIAISGDQFIPPNNNCELFNEDPAVGTFLFCSFLASYLLLIILA